MKKTYPKPEKRTSLIFSDSIKPNTPHQMWGETTEIKENTPHQMWKKEKWVSGEEENKVK